VFQTNQGLFEPTVMFFRLTNSPATFQAMINTLFHDLILQGKVVIYDRWGKKKRAGTRMKGRVLAHRYAPLFFCFLFLHSSLPPTHYHQQHQHLCHHLHHNCCHHHHHHEHATASTMMTMKTGGETTMAMVGKGDSEQGEYPHLPLLFTHPHP
jgi:hypothetical protein